MNALASELVLDTRKALTGFRSAMREINKIANMEGGKTGRDLAKAFSKGVTREDKQTANNIAKSVEVGSKKAKKKASDGGKDSGKAFADGMNGALQAIVGGIGFQAIRRGSEDLRRSFMELEDALNGVSKTANLTDEQTKILGDQVMDLSHNTRTSRDELLNFGQVGGMVGLRDDELIDFITTLDILNIGLRETFGQLGSEEVAMSVGKLSNIFRNDFRNAGISTSDAIMGLGSSMNELEKAGFSTGPAMADMAGRIGGVGAVMGMTADEALGIASILEETGVRTERGGTAVAQLLQRMSRNTEAFAAQAGMPLREFEELVNTDINEALIVVAKSLSSGDFKNTEVAQAFADLESTGAGVTEALTKIGQNTDDLRDRQKLAKDAFSDTTGIMAEYDKQQGTSSAAQERFNNKLENTKTKIQAQLQPAFDGMLERVGDLVVKIGEFAEENPALTRTIAGVVTAVGLLASGLLAAGGAFKVLKNLGIFDFFKPLKNLLLGKAGKGGAAGTKGLLGNLFGGIKSQFANLKNSKMIGGLFGKKGILGSLFGGGGKAAGAAKGIGIIGKLSLAFSKLGLVVKGIALSIATAIGAVSAPVLIVIAVVAALVAGFVYLWNTSDGFRNFFVDMWDSIVSAVSNAWNFISETFTKFVNFFMWAKDNKMEALGLMLGHLVKFGLRMFDWMMETRAWLISKAKEMWEAFVEMGVNNFNILVDFLKELPGRIWQSMQDFWAVFTDTVESAWNWMKETFSKENIIAVLMRFIFAVSEFRNRIVDSFKTLGKNAFDAVVDFFSVKNLMKIGDNIKDAISGAINWGKDQWSNFKKGFTDELQGNAPGGMATGGPVMGGQNVMKLLNDGKGSKSGQEYVINAEAVRAIGKPMLDALNNMKPGQNITKNESNTTNNITAPTFTNNGFQFV